MQVSIALVLAAAACAYVANRSSSDELAGAYRDSAQTLLAAATASFERRLDDTDLERPASLSGDLRELVSLHPELSAAAIYVPGESEAAASAGAATGSRVEARLAVDAMSSGEQQDGEAEERDRHDELLVTPLATDGRVRAALVAGYDLRPAAEALEDRNGRVFVVLALLLAGFCVFAAVLLQRGIFRPLNRLRLATRAVGAGDLGTRLGWRRRDELGELARDFDAMAGRLEENNRRLEELAHRDPLTGLANHRRFQELLGHEVESARREGHRLAVVLLDVDDFKRVNESRGHPFGDELLGAAAASSAHRPQRPGRGGARGRRRVRDRVAGRRRHARVRAGRGRAQRGRGRGERPRAAALLGAAWPASPTTPRAPGALLQLADGALLWAKESGRGRSRRYDPEHVFVVTDEQREDFAELIARPDAVRPVFQPIVALASGEPVGYEALARFDGKPGLPPSWWFSQAHRFGLGAALEAEAVRVALETPDAPATPSSRST